MGTRHLNDNKKPGFFKKPGFSWFFVALMAVFAPTVLFAQAKVSSAGNAWVLENAPIKVTFDPGSGKLAVLDKEAKVEYRQPAEPPAPPTKTITIPKAAGPIKADGDLSEWTAPPVAVLTCDMTPDGEAKNVKDNRDCSAVLYAAWDEENLYLAAKVVDEKLAWGEKGRERWWEKDSLEFWVAGRQVGMALTPEGAQARSASAAIDGGSKIALKVDPVIGASKDMDLVVKTKPQGGDASKSSGYVVEAVFPWGVFAGQPRPFVGAKVRFAFGVNDADDAGQREGQLYFPQTWVHSKPETFAEALLADASGKAPQEAAKQKAEPSKVRNVTALPRPAKGISFEVDAAGPQGKKLPVTVRLSLADDAADLNVEFDMPSRDAEIADFCVMEPLALDSAQGYFAVADYSNGHIYPLDDPKIPRKGGDAGRMDMPWIGMLDLQKGFGYVLVVDTPDDGAWNMRACRGADRPLWAPAIVWRPSMGKLSYPRRLIYHFSPSGSYVALAKYYREYAKGKGLIVPFTEKVKKNPNLDRLFGAPDVWGGGGLRFCREAKAAGVDRMLYNGRPNPEDMKEIGQLGYLTSEYDNYTDILPVEPGKEVGSNRAHLPDDAVLHKDGNRMKAWLTYDKKTQYMKRCPSLWVPTAKVVIKKVLEKYPYLARFIDVTTAEGLYECYDPKHLLTRTQKRECGVGLLSVVRENGLVVGGEHGIWWAVPVQDYVEGMMSGGFAAWPAGHLIYPKTMEELTKPDWKVKCGSWDDYQKYGIGPCYRVPLWELVFHDCIVTTWYWGDATDWLLNVDPANSEKKDAFNILYGTVPLMWAGPPGKPFQEHKEQFVRSYRNTCKIHEVLAYEELLSHEFVTPDHAVQRTRFSSGTECTVNFGEKPYTLKADGKDYVLPTNGFFVRGPKVSEYQALVDNKLVTYIRTPDYLFVDGHGQAVDTGAVSTSGTVTVRLVTPQTLRIIREGAPGPTTIHAKQLSPTWDVGTMRIYSLDENGRRAQAVSSEAASTSLGCFEVVCGEAARLPDLELDASSLKVSDPAPKQGQLVTVMAVIRNVGLAPAKAKVHAYLDDVDPNRRLLSKELDLQPDAETTLEVKVPTRWLDGRHRARIIADEENAAVELSDLNNEAACEIVVTADPALWPYKVAAGVSSGALARKDYPVALKVDLADLAKRAGAKGAVVPNTIRVFESDASGKPTLAVPSQFDAENDRDGRGELCWILTGATPPNTTRRFQILFDTDPANKLAPPSQIMWQDAKKTISTPAYDAVFEDGVITGLYDKLGALPDKSLVSSIILSSKETGWGREEGALDAFVVKHCGPVRTVIQVKKTLAQEYVYEKTYTFYPDWFEVETQINKSVGGLYSRIYYALEAQYEDDKGCKATMDGKGSGEGVYGKNKKPLWYCVYTPMWAHSCIALSTVDTIAYWDSGALGGIGFHASGLSGKVAYVLHPGQKDAGFAKADYEQLTKPPTAKLE